jgi:hypothetical protein
MSSILGTIKQMLGVDSADTAFDTEIIVHINSSLMTLTQIGVGPSDGFFITGETETWEQFLSGIFVKMEAVKTYIYIKVRLIFDPPSTAAVMDAMARSASEFEWRLAVQATPTPVPTIDLLGGDDD